MIVLSYVVAASAPVFLHVSYFRQLKLLHVGYMACLGSLHHYGNNNTYL